VNPCVVARAVIARIKADTTLYSGGAWTAALGGGASYNRGKPESLVFPFIVFDLSWSGDNNFTGIEGNARLSFNIYDIDERGLDRIENLVDRLIGDSMIASGTRGTPTYGFHNHDLQLGVTGATNILGWTSERWTFVDCSISNDGATANVASLAFSGRVGNQAVNV
jgi:hypothetical protein